MLIFWYTNHTLYVLQVIRDSLKLSVQNQNNTGYLILRALMIMDYDRKRLLSLIYAENYTYIFKFNSSDFEGINKLFILFNLFIKVERKVT